MQRQAINHYVTRELVVRTLTAAVYAPLVVLAVASGGLVWVAVVLIATVIASLEFYNLARHAGFAPHAVVGTLAAAALVLAAYADPRLAGAVVCVALALTPFWIGRTREPLGKTAFASWTSTLAGTVYTGGLLLYAVLLRNLPDGLAWTVTALIGTWANDAGAYLIGRALGRHKFAPRISPKKTWEGAIGGLLIGWSAAFLTARFFQLSPLHAAVLGAVIAVLAILGDLAESALKRASGAKDAGRFFPGHGGMLDRIDSLLFVLPAVYYALLLLSY